MGMVRTRSVGGALFLALVCSWLSFAQTSPSGPTPEHQKMAYFTGEWKLQGTMKAGPNTPAGDFKATEHGEWVPGNFFLQTHSNMHSVLGDVRSVRVMEYNPADKLYSYNVYNSLGEHLMAKGQVANNVWTWNSEAALNGVIAKGRYTITVVTPTTYNFKYETVSPSGTWSTVMEGTATKQPFDDKAPQQ